MEPRARQAVVAELRRALEALGLPVPEELGLEPPRRPEHGDLSSNVALVLARTLGRPPRALAEEIAARIDRAAAGLAAVEVAGPGFLNFRFEDRVWWEALRALLAAGDAYGRSDVGGGTKIMVEFVSANPTGPLHIGHGRQAALGDAISELLAWTGWSVHREFYYNDAGEQIERLARSVWARYQQHFGRSVAVPPEGYHGAYVAEIATDFAAEVGDRYVDDASPEALEAMRRFAVARLRDEQNRDLEAFRVRFDEFFLESSLYTSGKVAETIERLRATGLVYEKDGALWLRTTAFGDDKDRVMVKRTGQPTYFLPDVAYHLTKWERGFRHAINVMGADHHGTIARVRAALRALGLPPDYPEYVLHQMVTVVRGGEEVKFSKRAGDYVTLRELVDEVGVDVARYFFLERRADAHLTFDLDLALDQSERNPVYKIQYAHARMCSIFRRAGRAPTELDIAAAPLHRLVHPLERGLLRELVRLPEEIRAAAAERAPHRMCSYLEALANAVNAWYHAGNRDRSLRVLGVEPELSEARMALARAVQITLRNGLAVLGIAAPERMARLEEEEATPEAAPAP